MENEEGRYWNRSVIGITLAGLLLAAASPAAAQIRMMGEDGRPGKPMGADLAILDIKERRTDLPCEILRVKPSLGFDLKLHARFQIRVPMSAVSGGDNMLTSVFRVTPVKPAGPAQYFYQRTAIPFIEEGRSGDLYANGTFDVGPGQYAVDFLVRDRAHHVCSDYWNFAAEVDAIDSDLSLSLFPGAIEPSDDQAFREEPPVLRAQNQLLRVKVLVNFAPQKRYAPTLDESDYLPLLSILRGISRQPQFGKFSLVAFNLDEQSVFYRQDDADRIDFPGLGEALQGVSPGVVNVSALGDNTEAAFLERLMADEVGETEHLDALIFAGPKTTFDERISKQTLHGLGQIRAPIYYLNYNLSPVEKPWRDAIGHAVKFWKGVEYSINKPRDLWSALTNLVHNVVQSRETTNSFAPSSH